MFDRVVLAPTQHTTEYVTRNVHEHRAPTDESVKILREMEDKAQERIVESIHVGNTTFDCVVHIQENMLDQTMVFIAAFSLNGKKMTVKHVAERWRHDYSRDKAFVALRDAMASEIATAVLVHALERLK